MLYQGPDGSFNDVDYGAVSGSSQWGMCVADFDNDGHKDVFSGGSYDGVHVQHITAPGLAIRWRLAMGICLCRLATGRTLTTMVT